VLLIKAGSWNNQQAVHSRKNTRQEGEKGGTCRPRTPDQSTKRGGGNQFHPRSDYEGLIQDILNSGGGTLKHN